MATLIYAFTLLFVTMGPMKVTMVFADRAGGLDPHQRRRIAIRAVSIAAVIGLIFVLIGPFLMNLFHFSLPSLMLAGGTILFVFAIQLVLGEAGDTHQKELQPDEDLSHIAVYPLAVPLMASPVGLVSLTVASAINHNNPPALLVLAGMLLLVMAIDLCVLLLAGKVLKYIHPQIVQVAERILGILLAALGVETILNGLRALGVLAATGH